MDNFSNKITIDLSAFESRLRGQIGSDLTALQIVLDGISKPEYGNSHYTLQQGFTHAIVSVPPSDFLQQREINKCFKSIIGSLQDYMDNLLAVLHLKKEKVSLSRSMTSDEISNFIQSKFTHHLLDVSTNRSLNIPKKLDLLLDQPEHQVYKDSLQSYFDVRNGLEHHKGIAKTNRTVKFRRFGIASTAGYEIKELGPLGENEGIVLQSFDEEIAYDKGGVLLISRSHLDSIVLHLLVTIIPTMQKIAGDKLNSE